MQTELHALAYRPVEKLVACAYTKCTQILRTYAHDCDPLL